VVSVEMWFGRYQVISYPHSFGSTIYVKIPTELEISKLELRVTRLTLVRYFEHGSYKLLNYVTESVYSTRNVIFKKDTTNFMKGTVYMKWKNDDDSMLVHMMTERLAGVQVIR